jgi:chromosomal replication initiation ATPase DnaA
MSEEKEIVVISPYVFAGIRPIDLPESFFRKMKVNVLKYKLDHVINGIYRYVKISDEQLKSRCREREYCDARHMYCYILRTKMDYSLIQIGRSIGRDHTTAINSINKHKNLYNSDQKYKALFDRVDRYVEIMSASDDGNGK